MRYRVLVDDDFHYRDESERYELGEFETLEEAVAACKRVVDEFLMSNYRPGMTAAELYTQYALFGEDSFVVYSGQQTVPFSARDYASRRVEQICHGQDSGAFV